MSATAFLYALSCVITCVTALFAWRRRSERSLANLAGVMASIAVWGLFSVLEMTAPELPLKLFFIHIVNLAIASAVILMFFFVLEFYRRDGWLTRKRKSYFWIIPLITLGLSITNPLHHWIWTDFIPGPPGSDITYYIQAPGYYLTAFFQLALAVWMLSILITEARSTQGAERLRTIWIMASICVSILPYVIYLIFPGITLGYNLMPVGLAISGLLISWIVFEDLDRQMQSRTQQLDASVDRLKLEIAERVRAEQALQAVQDSLTHRVAEQSRNLSGIYELTLLAGEIEDLPRLLHESLQRIASALAADAACIHRRAAAGDLAGGDLIDGGALLLLAEYNLSPAQRTLATELPGTWLAHGDAPRVLLNMNTPNEPPAALRLPGLSSAIAVPLTIADEFSGILTVFWSQPDIITVEGIELFGALVKQVALVIENTYLRRRIESAAAARERRRLARDLHDSVTQSLHSLTFTAYTAGNRLRQGRLDQLDESLRQLSDGAAQALKEMRLLLFEMRLAPLESLDLIEALQTRLDAVEKRAGIDAAILLDSDPLWPKAWESEIYCVAMEALNNSLKHAHAGQVRVRLGMQDNCFQLEVADNGQGFDTAHLTRAGMGLHNMAERVERLGGQLHIDAAPGRGACIQMICRLNEVNQEPKEPLNA